jgi:uncharacterized membrane protein
VYKKIRSGRTEPGKEDEKQVRFTRFLTHFLFFEDTCLSPFNDTSITDMETGNIPHYLLQLCGAITKALVLVVVLPLTTAFLFTIPIPSTLALITSTLVIEYGAAPIGIGLGLHPAFVLYVLVCVALGVTLALFDTFDIMGEHSERVSQFLKKSSKRAKQSSFLTKYGIYGLVPCVFTLGFYVCPPVSWVLGWRRDRSILLIMAGYITISIVTILATRGIFSLVF